ncbi:hypothetical protein [Arthrobacter sp. ok362]|uniref:hypothetical protein n=1 Tax=Arthrobacter sp. ok362 TaxID=1761745 RepID=UPI0008876E85|nr:hypothetical protein [Arthrobacter sp. ok362]SDK80950.1 hypothetical protein SAMN04487913_103250 [Arthrobacter sp. ok362]
MSQIPGFESAQRAFENMLPPEDVEQCEDGDCDECMECLAAIAQDQADAYAEGQWEEHRLERRYGE